MNPVANASENICQYRKRFYNIIFLDEDFRKSKSDLVEELFFLALSENVRSYLLSFGSSNAKCVILAKVKCVLRDKFSHYAT